MAENYSLNSRFGLNVSSQGAKNQNAQAKENTLAQKFDDLFGNSTNFVDKYENVFNGDVAKEINMYSRQAMIVGMNLRNGEEKHKFDMNI